jgi:hypothetical protein
MNYRITKRSIHNFMSDSIAARKLSKAFLPAVGVAVFFLLLHRVEASNKFWIATSPGNFGDDSNWSLSSGGPANTTAWPIAPSPRASVFKASMSPAGTAARSQ